MSIHEATIAKIQQLPEPLVQEVYDFAEFLLLRSDQGRWHAWQDFHEAAELGAAGLDVPAERRNLGLVFQSYALWPHMTVFDNVAYPLSVRHVARAEIRERVTAALRLVEMERYADRPAPALSGGQQQRVAIARAIVNTPSLLLADEPTGNLDSATSDEIMGIFQRLNDELGITLVLVTHEPDIALFARRIIRFRDGNLVEDNPVVDRRKPPSADVAPT